MSLAPIPARFRTALRALCAVVALISQMTLGSLVLPDRAAAAPLVSLEAATVICDGAVPARPVPAQHHRRPVHDAACPLDLALDLASVIPFPAVVPPPRPAAAGRTAALPSARAPPGIVAWVRHARDPPDLA